MIRLSQGWVLYLLIFGMIPLLLSIRSYVWGKGGYAFLNRTNMEVVKGLSILLVIFQSLCERLAEPSLVTTWISKSGVLGVTLFLFCCGFESMTQYMSNRRYLRGFLIYQVIRSVFVFLVCNMIGALVNIFVGGHDGFMDVFRDTMMLRFADGTSAWLIGALLYFYVVFYVSYRTKYKMNLLLWMSVVYIGLSSLVGWNISVAFCFFIGAFFAEYKKYLFHFIRKYLSGLFIGSLLTFSSAYVLYLKGFSFIAPLLSYLFLVFVLCVLMKLQCRSRVLALIGQGAIELYLIHELLLVLVLGYSEARNGAFLIIFWLVSIVMALLIKNVSCRMFFVPKQQQALK